MSPFSEVHYYSDNELSPEAKYKLGSVCASSNGRHHGAYDFGSWAKIISELGWDYLNNFDELILINDSCYGPFYDLAKISDEMSARPCDFWGMTSNSEIAFHIQSYFIAFKKPILADLEFQKFWANVCPQASYKEVVRQYEIGLSHMLIERKYAPSTWLNSRLDENLTLFPLTTVRDHDMPLIKVKCFSDPYIGSRERISSLTRHVRAKHPIIAELIARHQGPGFLTRAILAQKRDQPIYANFPYLKMRSIRGDRLKLVLFGRWRLIFHLGPALMKRLSRVKALHARL